MTLQESDRTFSTASEFGSIDWAAATIGRSKDWFFRKRKTLEDAGFPKPDDQVDLYIKADVLAWIRRRRKYSDDDLIEGPENDEIDYSQV